APDETLAGTAGDARRGHAFDCSVLEGMALMRLQLRRTALAMVIGAMGFSNSTRGEPQAPAQPDAPLLIHAARLLDGRGGTIANATIEVRGSKIVTIDQRRGPYT